jgi:hypothetical protein
MFFLRKVVSTFNDTRTDFDNFGGFHISGGTPIAGLFIIDNPTIQCIMTGGTPI